jgi:hypothetical protein
MNTRLGKFLTVLAFIGSVSANAAEHLVSKGVAIMDFEVTNAPSDAKWSFGLADVLAVELQRQGVAVFERQQIRMVLNREKSRLKKFQTCSI